MARLPLTQFRLSPADLAILDTIEARHALGSRAAALRYSLRLVERTEGAPEPSPEKISGKTKKNLATRY